MAAPDDANFATLARTLGDMERAEQQQLAVDGPAPLATFVSTDGRVIRIYVGERGELTLRIGGREPVVLDRFQASAFMAAMAECA